MTNETKNQNALTEPADLTGSDLLYLHTLVSRDVVEKRNAGYLNTATNCQAVAEKVRALYDSMENQQPEPFLVEIRNNAGLVDTFENRPDFVEARDRYKKKTLWEGSWQVRPQNYSWTLNGEYVIYHDPRLRS